MAPSTRAPCAGVPGYVVTASLLQERVASTAPCMPAARVLATRVAAACVVGACACICPRGWLAGPVHGMCVYIKYAHAPAPRRHAARSVAHTDGGIHLRLAHMRLADARANTSTMFRDRPRGWHLKPMASGSSSRLPEGLRNSAWQHGSHGCE
jgi:hypothetical protein